MKEKINLKDIKELKERISVWLISLGYKTKDFNLFIKEIGNDKSSVKFHYVNKRLTCSLKYENELNRNNEWSEFDLFVCWEWVMEIIKEFNRIMDLVVY